MNLDTNDEDRESKALFTTSIKSILLYLKDFMLDVWRVLSNKLWLCCFVGDLFSAFGWGGIFLFLPKTLEVQVIFRLHCVNDCVTVPYSHGGKRYAN